MATSRDKKQGWVPFEPGPSNFEGNAPESRRTTTFGVSARKSRNHAPTALKIRPRPLLDAEEMFESRGSPSSRRSGGPNRRTPTSPKLKLYPVNSRAPSFHDETEPVLPLPPLENHVQNTFISNGISERAASGRRVLAPPREMPRTKKTTIAEPSRTASTSSSENEPPASVPVQTTVAPSPKHERRGRSTVPRDAPTVRLERPRSRSSPREQRPRHTPSTTPRDRSSSNPRESFTRTAVSTSGRGRSSSRTHERRSEHHHASTTSRGRSSSRPSSRPRTEASTSTRTRSENRPRTEAPTKGRTRSESRPRSSTGGVATIGATSQRGRSSSRSRPPPTRPNAHRNRSRSASLTRVTHPTSPSQVTRSLNAATTPRTRAPKPPSTARTRNELRHIAGSSSGSIGPGYRGGRSTRSDDGSVALSDSHMDSVSVGSKRRGFKELFFGGGSRSSANDEDLIEHIHPRILLAATVYHNTATNLWITTINTNQKGVSKNPALANKFLKAFSFPTEREARESAIANAPPKMMPFKESPQCFICNNTFALFRRASHCRNCGVCVCANCTSIWGSKMVPETYNLKNESKVTVCRTCDKLSSDFKKALLAGDYEEATSLYSTGNINLRTPFPNANKKDEVMYPVHCAIEGGNIDIVRWLIDDHFCPIKLVRAGAKKAKRGSGSTDVLIQTSRARTVLSIAMERLKVEIMRYLVVECSVSIYETTDLKLSLRALEATLTSLPRNTCYGPRDDNGLSAQARWDTASFDDISEPSSLGSVTVDSKSHRTRTSARSRGDSCIICCDRKIDCVATPCGHQVCCLECSKNLSLCPVCNNKGDFIKIFRP